MCVCDCLCHCHYNFVGSKVIFVTCHRAETRFYCANFTSSLLEQYWFTLRHLIKSTADKFREPSLRTIYRCSCEPYSIVPKSTKKCLKVRQKAGNQRKFESLNKFENLKIFENLKFKIAQVDPRDMLNNFCFHV